MHSIEGTMGLPPLSIGNILFMDLSTQPEGSSPQLQNIAIEFTHLSVFP
jgi:hypothetical protein